MLEYILELKHITKEFPGAKALDDVHFHLRTGEIHALMGENGAGKSTFIKIITGVYQPDEGEMYFEGQKVNFKNPKESQKAGISAIYQHSTSYPSLTVTENIFIGHEEVGSFTKRILWNKMHKKAQDILDTLGADFTSKKIIGTLSVAQRQMVEIAKALSSHAKVIIMDEPTASLTKKESEELYRITEDLRDKGVAIIFISHRFEDMYRIASKVTVLRDAKYIGSWCVNNISREELVFSMVGRDINQLFPNRNATMGEVVLSVRNLSSIGRCDNISFEVRKGEILGFTGLIGSGRTEVFEALLGITDSDIDEVHVNKKKVVIKHPLDAMNIGIGYLPEDRQIQGLMLDWGIDYNVSLANMSAVSHHVWINFSREINMAKKISEKVKIKANSVFDKVSLLSGGNQQKVVIGKLLTQELRIIILDEPTKGVDVAAKSAIYHIMNDLANQGYAIIMISSEIPEVLGMSDRIIVMKEGRIVKTFLNNGDITQEMILKASMALRSVTGRTI